MSYQHKTEMVQILNKFKRVHLKYAILEICCCHKHCTQLPPLDPRLKFDTKLRNMLPSNLAAYLCAIHSCRYIENTALNFQIDCLFQPIKFLKNARIYRSKPDFWLHLALVILFKCLFPDPNLAKSWGMCPQVVMQHGSAQVIVTGEICRVLAVNFDCLLWPIKCVHSKTRF